MQTRDPAALAGSLGLDENQIRYNLPVVWVRTFIAATGFDPRGAVVWSFEDSEDGRPRPLTEKAQSAIKTYNKKVGTSYPTDDEVV